MSTEPKFYAVDALNAYPEPVGTDDKLELNLDMGAVYIHLNYKRAKLVGLQSLDFLISQLEVIRTEALGQRKAAPAVEQPKGSGSLDFDVLLAKFHEEVWEAAQATALDEIGAIDYDMAGVDIAKKLQAIFRAQGAPVFERQEPVATVKENPYCPEGMSDEISVYLPVGTKLYAEQPAPQVHEWDINDHGTATVCSICGVRSSDEQPAPVAVVRDAERYQFLRSRDLETIADGGVFAGMTPDNVVLNGEDLDAAIDVCLDKVKELNQSSIIAGFKVVEDPAIPPNEVRICNCNQGRLPCSCKS